MLTRVTITGADDDVDPEILRHLWKLYPFVEWGLLMSQKRRGSLRYASAMWLNHCYQLFPDGLGLAWHLCGAFSQEAMLDSPNWNSFDAVRRVQLNGFPGQDPKCISSLLKRFPETEFIAQVRDTARANLASALAKESKNLVALCDSSGGEGIKPKSWNPIEGVRMGYAGGIDPHNIREVIQEILSIHESQDLGDFLKLVTGSSKASRVSSIPVSPIFSR